MKKYTLLLVTLALLASCATEVPIDTVNEEINTLSGAATSSVIEQIEEEIETVPENSIEILPLPVETEISAEKVDAMEAPIIETPGVIESKVIEFNQTYTSPGGEEKVAFSITLDGEKISSVKVVGTTDNDISQKYIGKFSDSINEKISGKTLEEAQSIGIVGGSSLTTGAFKKALKNM